MLAATDDRAVNRRIREDCQSAGIMVNVADDRSLCDFYFPSVVMTDDAVIGISGDGSDHAGVKRDAQADRKSLQSGEKFTLLTNGEL